VLDDDTASSCFCFFSFAFFISHCAHGPLFFCLLSSWDERTKKVMGMPVFSDWFRVFPLSAGNKATEKPILLSVLLLYFSFSFLCFVFCSVFLLSVFALIFFPLFFSSVFPFSVLGFLLLFIEKLAPQPVLPLQDCYGIHERDRGQETWSMIGFVADFQVSGWIGMKKTTWLFHQQRRRFVRKWHFHFDPCFLWEFDS